MAAWRRKALELFPQIPRSQLQRYSIYHLFSDLSRLAEVAHKNHDSVLLKQIYLFAEWCFQQKAKNMWNSASVAFYEHVFDQPKYMEQTVNYLSSYVIENVWVLWEERLDSQNLEKLKQILKEQKRTRLNISW